MGRKVERLAVRVGKAFAARYGDNDRYDTSGVAVARKYVYGRPVWVAQVQRDFMGSWEVLAGGCRNAAEALQQALRNIDSGVLDGKFERTPSMDGSADYAERSR